MKIFKKTLAVLIAVMLLSFTVGSDYFDATHMDKVEATTIGAAAGLSAAALFKICVFVGSVFAISWAVGEVIDNQEEIARAGKNFIDSVAEIPNEWLFTFTDADTGQEYVIGSEAIEQVQGTSWEVIKGGGGADRGDDDGNNNNIIKFPDLNKNVGGALTAGAAWLVDNAARLYRKWVNGEEMTEAELAAIEPLVSGYCNQYDVAAQWNGSFTYSGVGGYSYVIGGRTYEYSYDYTLVRDLPVCGYYHVDTPASGSSNWSSWYYLDFYKLNANKNGISKIDIPYTETRIYGGVLQPSSSGSSQGLNFVINKDYSSYSFTYGLNFPVFASLIDAENYLMGRGDVTKALNYAKVYRHADWLSDDWAGQLVDPLTNIGLTLSQLLALMKALGLTAVGNNLSPAELIELIKKSLPVVNPDLLPGETPVTIPDPAPGTDPIYYPTPDAHPKPTKPKPGGDTDPDPDPEPGTDPDPEMSNYKVELTGVFPFCIPFDFIALLKVLSAEPEAPRFALPVVIPALGYEDTFYIDMSIFDDAAEVMRTFEKISFLVFLMFATSKVIRW